MEFEEFDKKMDIEVDGFVENGKQFDVEIKGQKDNRNVIFGVIKDEYGDPIEDAVVKLIEVDKKMGKKERKPVSHTFTDNEGEFVFGPLCPNRDYEIQFWANRVKHVKVCKSAKPKKQRCLKGEKIECCKEDFPMPRDKEIEGEYCPLLEK